MSEPEGAALMLLSWMRGARRATKLFQILKQTRDDELMTVMTLIGGDAGRIAWAEYGRRKFGIEFALENGSAVPFLINKKGRDELAS